MVINGVKLEPCRIFNPYRRGMDAPVPAEPIPMPAIESRRRTGNWRGQLARRVRHIPTGKVFDSAEEAGNVLGLAPSTVRVQCAPSNQYRRTFEYADGELVFDDKGNRRFLLDEKSR